MSGKVGVPGHVLLLQDSSRVMTELLEYESLDAIWYERSEGVPWGPAATRFGIAGHWGVAGDSVVVVADGLSGTMSWYSLVADSAKVASVVKTGLAGDPVSATDRERLTARERARRTVIPRDAGWVLPALKPGISKIIVDTRGFVWVRGMIDTTDWSFTDWHVFAPFGTGSTAVTLPSDLDVRAVGGNRIYGIARGPLDVPVIRVLQFDRAMLPGATERHPDDP